MTIHLPGDLEDSIRAAVDSGRFAPVEDAMTAAARLLLGEISRRPIAEASSRPPDADLGSIGAMRDDADLLDQAVEHARSGPGGWIRLDRSLLDTERPLTLGHPLTLNNWRI